MTILPDDGLAGTLVARVEVPGVGPSVVALRQGGVFDITRAAPTMAHLTAAADPVARAAGGTRLCEVEALLANSALDARDPAKPYLLAPVDLHVLKAAGVTFVVSMLERVIEEATKGDPSGAAAARARLLGDIGDVAKIKPGSPAADALKARLIERGLWSQYLEVGIGPYAEIFTKSQPMSAVGAGALIGVRPDSTWNNPEPEAVLIVSPAGKIVGAALGNDVNLRDMEGRSALLLGKAKDNNASCAIGPFIRLFDATFSLDDLRRAEIALEVKGPEGFELSGKSSLAMITRDLADLVGQTIGPHHQYPDGFALFTGTMFAPTKDRGAAGKGFTHASGDEVTIASPKLGRLVNRVTTTDKAPPWTFGVTALMTNLARRGLLQ